MTQPTANPSLLKRVVHVTVVALCTASSLALIGAVPAQWAKARMSAKPAAKVSAVQIEAPLPQLAAFSINPKVDTKVELLKDVAEVTIAPAPEARTIRMEVTAYCPCVKCCGPNAQGITASGKLVSYNEGKFVAADTGVLPFGTKLVIPGYADNTMVEVIDRGGAIKGNKLDLYFATHAEALVWGRQQVDVTIYE
jgi:3D (Asp-Asp-Asp) domain-containing protein